MQQRLCRDQKKKNYNRILVVILLHKKIHLHNLLCAIILEIFNFQEANFVYTCGACERSCYGDNGVLSHSCLEGYSNYLVDDNSYYFYPMLGICISVCQLKAVLQLFEMFNLLYR